MQVQGQSSIISKYLHFKSGFFLGGGGGLPEDSILVPKYDFNKKNSVALVRERTIPAERPPPVGEVSANFLRIEGCHVVSATDSHGR